MLYLLVDSTLKLIKSGALLLGLLLGLGILIGFAIGRRKVDWELDARFHETSDALEWERAERKKLLRKMLQVSESVDQQSLDLADLVDERVGVLEKELRRQYEGRQKDWRVQSEAETRIQRLEARIRVLSGAVHRKENEEEPAADRRIAGTKDKILTLWNSAEEAQDPLDTAIDNGQ